MDKNWWLVIMVRDRQINAYRGDRSTNKTPTGFACYGEEGICIDNIDVMLPLDVLEEMKREWEKNFGKKS